MLSSHTLNNYAKLLEDSDEYNVVITIGQEPDIRTFNAHSIILRAQSPYFHRALSREWRKEEDGKILFEKPNVSPKIFEFILKYIYSGDTSLGNFNCGELTDVIIAADEFNLQDLVDYIKNKLLLSPENWITKYFVRIFKCVSKQDFCCKELEEYCNQKISESPSIILRTDDFTLLDEEMLVEFLKLEDHGMRESDVWDRVIRWGTAQHPSITFDETSGTFTEENLLKLKETLSKCTTYVKFSSLTKKEFFNQVKPFKKIFHPDYYEDILWNYINENESNDPRNSGIPQIDDNNDTNASTQFDSEIIRNDHFSLISRWLNTLTGKTCNNFRLLMSSNNEGFSSQVFSRICDEIRFTLVVLTVEGTNEILGGYSPLRWGSRGECWKQTRDSFIFSFSDKENFRNYRYSYPVDDKKAIYRSGTNGPNFGGGDLAMGQGFSLKRDCICVQTNYVNPIRSDSSYFRIESFEIFEVCFDE